MVLHFYLPKTFPYNYFLKRFKVKEVPGFKIIDAKFAVSYKLAMHKEVIPPDKLCSKSQEVLGNSHH